MIEHTPQNPPPCERQRVLELNRLQVKIDVVTGNEDNTW